MTFHLFAVFWTCLLFWPGGELTRAQAATANSATGIERLYEEAKKEGEVVWTLATQRFTPVANFFQEKYPDVKVKAFFKNSRDAATQLIAEGRARERVSIDVATMDLRRSAPLIERGIAASEDWTRLGVSPGQVWGDGFLIGGYDIVDGIYYNPALVKPAEIPKTWDDLLSPKWANYQIATTTATSGLAAVYYTRSAAEADAYLRKLAAQKIALEQSGAVIARKFANGEYKIVLASLGEVVQMREQKIPVEAAPIGPVIISRRGLMTFKKSPHPSAAKLVMVWLASEQGRKAMREIGGQGAAFPCDESELAALVCKHNLQAVFLATMEKTKEFDSFAKRAQEILRP